MKDTKPLKRTQKAARQSSLGNDATELMKNAFDEFTRAIKAENKGPIVFFPKGIDNIQVTVKIGNKELSFMAGGPAANAG